MLFRSRTYFDFAGSACGLTPDGAIAVALYSDATANLPGAKVAVSGGYPYADTPVCVSVTREKPGKVRFRIPRWSRSFRLDGKNVESKDGWFEVDAPAGEKSWSLAFDMSPRTEDIPAGGHVHTHNLHTGLSGALEYEYHPTHPALEPREAATFMGYPRRLGRPGIRNEL